MEFECRLSTLTRSDSLPDSLKDGCYLIGVAHLLRQQYKLEWFALRYNHLRALQTVYGKVNLRGFLNLHSRHSRVDGVQRFVEDVRFYERGSIRTDVYLVQSLLFISLVLFYK